jgi:glucose-6-phosphate isomerase
MNGSAQRSDHGVSSIGRWLWTELCQLLHLENKRFTVVLLQRKRHSAIVSSAFFYFPQHSMGAVHELSPFRAFVDVTTLEIQPNTGGYLKRIGELDGIYADQKSFEQVVQSRSDEIAYRVNELRFTGQSNDLITGISVLNPGKVGSEFFMTRGHLHQRADRPETYYCLAGHGILLMETLEGKVEAAEMRTGSLVYVPPFWIHRSVNVGSELFATLFSYPADAGQNFEIVRQAGGFNRIVIDNGVGGWNLAPNPRYNVRTPNQIEEYSRAGL